MPDPQCARHVDKDHLNRKVVKAGTTSVGEHPRQMFWCYPGGVRADPGRHRYVGVLARTVLQPSDPTFCADCSTDLQFHEGPIHAQRYAFPTRAIAAAMVAVGTGSSYNAVARTIRSTFDRHSKDGRRPALKGANGTLVADWVATHGPALCAAVTEGVTWPRVVALDDLPFLGSKARHKAAEDLGHPRERSGGVCSGPTPTPAVTEEHGLALSGLRELLAGSRPRSAAAGI